MACADCVRRSSAAVATSREGDRSPRSAWKSCADDGGGDCQEYRLDAAMIFPVNKIPIRLLLRVAALKRWKRWCDLRRIGPIVALHPHNRPRQECGRRI